MKYMGGKNRIAKDILPIILESRKSGQCYVEPFVGGCNVIDKVDYPTIGSDNNKYLIALWKGLQENLKGVYPISKDTYDRARKAWRDSDNSEFSDFQIGWIGFMASYNGRFFDGGYSGNYTPRDYISESIRNITNQIPKILDTLFTNCSYDEVVFPLNSIIYCDIPYKGTKQYSTSKDFNHEKFWNWCREMSALGHRVFVSEYNAPSDFKCVWSKTVTNSINGTKTYRPIEKLFTIGE